MDGTRDPHLLEGHGYTPRASRLQGDRFAISACFVNLLFGPMHDCDISQSKARIQYHTPVAYRQRAIYGLMVTGHVYGVM